MKITMMVNTTKVTIETDYDPCSSSDISRTDAAKKELFEKMLNECVKQLTLCFRAPILIQSVEGDEE